MCLRRSSQCWRDSAPLWPAGHLPHEGGDQLSRRLSPLSDVEERAPPAKLPISPPVGEMSGRTEGGAKELHGSILQQAETYRNNRNCV
ncbi:hypothetical protein FJW07_07115 [Mesorhizobium sp. B3-1-9]|nr:hypothetical protein FJW07_07115 [Mesorhizobium sp. B3-1-9]TPI43748.1 hypothetical protein FJ414_02730 [Mesorhizobium sp. B3-1-6]